MNKQKKGSSFGIEWTDYTWNPVKGCMHGCSWIMPNGVVANCYAEDVANKVAVAAYPQGFEHHYWDPDILEQPVKVKTSSKIFVGSMADVFGAWVPEYQIEAILEVCQKAPQHQFQFLTKNAPRLLKFEFPENVWVGVSSPPDYMFGKQLDWHQQQRMLFKSLDVLRDVKASVKWMSFEPLSWNVSWIVRQYPGTLNWAVVGAASSGRQYFPPKQTDVQQLVEVLDGQKCSIFFKGNMKSLNWARYNWRGEFPNGNDTTN